MRVAPCSISLRAIPSSQQVHRKVQGRATATILGGGKAYSVILGGEVACTDVILDPEGSRAMLWCNVCARAMFWSCFASVAHDFAFFSTMDRPLAPGTARAKFVFVTEAKALMIDCANFMRILFERSPVQSRCQMGVLFLLVVLHRLFRLKQKWSSAVFRIAAVPVCSSFCVLIVFAVCFGAPNFIAF